jgi:hypothetical protein
MRGDELSSADAVGVSAQTNVLGVERELEQATSARPQDPARLAAALKRAVDMCRRMPEATSGVFYLPELLGELAESYERLDRTDDALSTMRAALDAGYTGASDPRCRLAENSAPTKARHRGTSDLRRGQGGNARRRLDCSRWLSGGIGSCSTTRTSSAGQQRTRSPGAPGLWS